VIGDLVGSVWVYVEIEPDGAEGIVGIIGIMLPEAGTTFPRATSRERLLPQWNQLAAAHAGFRQASGITPVQRPGPDRQGVPALG
jgi:hypothetical protein